MDAETHRVQSRNSNGRHVFERNFDQPVQTRRLNLSVAG
jgi:hypothetical protein